MQRSNPVGGWSWKSAERLCKMLSAYCGIGMRFGLDWIYSPFHALLKRGKRILSELGLDRRGLNLFHVYDVGGILAGVAGRAIGNSLSLAAGFLETFQREK